MPVAASQVEVQAPPGLESVSYGMSTSSLVHGGAAEQDSSSHGEEAAGPAAGSGSSRPKSEQELKDAIVHEVTEAVREHVERKTTLAVESLWQRGQRAMQHLQQQQATQTEQLQGQLAACAESYRSLERENAVLRSRLEALMKHLTLVMGPPPHCMPTPPGMTAASPFGGFPPGRATQEFHPPTASPDGSSSDQPSGGNADGAAATAADTASAAAAAAVAALAAAAAAHPAVAATPVAQSPQTPKAEASQEFMADFGPTTPQMPSLPAAADDACDPGTSGAAAGAAAIVTPSLHEGADLAAALTPDATPAASEAQPADAAALLGASLPTSFAPVTPVGAHAAPSFTLTLRRADNVPLGLDVRGESGESFLIVDTVRPGGAVEAWNRQCAGDSREIRQGDRIIMINSAEDADAMREECLTKHLLKMTVLRGVPSVAPPISPTLAAAAAVAAAVAAAPPSPFPEPAPGLERAISGGGLRAEADVFVPQAGPQWPH